MNFQQVRRYEIFKYYFCKRIKNGENENENRHLYSILFTQILLSIAI
jgi:hypothetical protein